jgi:hypothetical protein
MEYVIAIVEKMFGEAWKKFCSVLPSPVEVSSRQREKSDSHLVLRFYLRNLGTVPIRDYSLAAHLPTEVAQHLRLRNRREAAKPTTIYSTGPELYNDVPVSDYERSRGVTGKSEQAKTTEHPLLPAGRPIPVLDLDFYTYEEQEKVMTDLFSFPIKVEYWGGSGTKHELTLFLRQIGNDVEYAERKQGLLPFIGKGRAMVQK